MDESTYHVQADWDPEAGVWVTTSEDVPGLATEADTIEALTEKLRVVVPELLEANQVLPSIGLQRCATSGSSGPPVRSLHRPVRSRNLPARLF
jgi:predicted RNase H-like HicB family nuclease